MDIARAKKIQSIYQMVRIVVLIALLVLIGVASANAQEMLGGKEKTLSVEERLAMLEQQMVVRQRKDSIKERYLPQTHGILRGKFEYQTGMNKGRFEVRNARLSASGKLPLRSEYKLEVDLCDESSIKMKDAWVRLNPWKTLRLTVGQQRMPFSIDAHRNPSAQYFANRSFIAKQVGDMRDVGFQTGYDIINKENRKVLSLDAGVFNGSNLDNQKSAWFSSPAYSARIQYFPIKQLAIVPSIQHQQIAERKASYTSLDFGTYYEAHGWHVEAEYLHKFYAKDAFADCSAVDAMVIYKHKLENEKSFIEGVSFLGRYDWMQDHSSGKNGFTSTTPSTGAKYATDTPTSTLALTDAERHRMTLGTTLHIRNSYFPTDLRFNYEKYWYPHGGAKESEQDKIVCELMIKF